MGLSHFSEKEIKQMLFKVYTYNEISDFMYDFKKYEWKLNINKHQSFEGFHYFSLHCLQHGFNGEKCLIAFDKKETPQNIIGVLWFGEYGFTTKQQSVSFIDVRKDCRQKGIATALIKEFNNYIDKSRPLYLSQLSQDGKNCHIDTIFKKYINTEIIVEN